MRVYNFLNPAHALENIKRTRLKVSRINDLNDPFEFLSADLLDPRNRAAFTKFKNEINEIHGIICFSKSWNNPLLWGHYADKHRGVALGFDIPDDHLIKVKYTTQRAKVIFDETRRSIIDGKSVLKNIIRTKFIDWKYENEHRIFVELKDCTLENGLYFCSFSEKILLKEVIFGLNFTADHNDFLNSAPISLIGAWKVGLALRKYNLIEDRSFRHQIKTRTSIT